jgi:L-lactate dehydrogenase (cytochrome)
VDGGLKRGSDVLMALALGARGVVLGRAFLWAQTAYGEKGVIRSIRSESVASLQCVSETSAELPALVLESEITMAMRLLSVNKISDLKPVNIECLQEVWR